MSILIFLLVLFVLILVHEWGHFIVAKKTGMRVDEFGIGFPPKLFGIKKGETEYSFNSLPIGGFVRIWGENGSEEAKELPETERARAFDRRPRWAQALVLIAGVTMNVLFAWLLFSVTYIVGTPTAVEESFASESAQLYITNTLPDSPATVLPAGSIVTSISYGEERIESPTPSEFSGAVTLVAPQAVEVTYTHKGEIGTAILIPVQGLDESEPDRYAVGAALAMVEVQRQSVGAAIVDGFNATWRGLVAITVGLSTLISQAVVGEADFSQVAGPVGIVGMVGDAASFGFTALLTFTAIISLNLAIINLLPVPALDGGRLVFVAIEAVTRRPIPPQWAGRVNFAGFALLMLLMVAVTYNDILRLLA
jgi:regulator of sigma E protease